VKIPVDRLFGSDVDAIEVDQVVRPAGDVGTRYPDGVRVVATIGRITHGVYMEGRVDGVETETCVRCLEEFRRPTSVDIEEAFSEDVAPEDALFSDVSPLVDRRIDLDELVAQLLEVDEPMAAVCDERCKGICPVCGGNRNVTNCDCKEPVVDERLAGLSRLLQERDNN
jgi:uncharacterized metal-binding protein YceD (DUF177 family)